MIKSCLRIFIATSVLNNFVNPEKYLPVLLWHSAGETCCGDEMNLYTALIKSQLGDVHVKAVRIGDSTAADYLKSLTVHPFDQIDLVCKQLQSDPEFSEGYHGIGLSQGGLLIRGLAQVCPYPPMRNLISLGAPQQGVHQYPRCENQFGALCGTLHSAANSFAYSWASQRFCVPLTYWHDTNKKRYRMGSSFLALINNEREYNENYVVNLLRLEHLILVKYAEDRALVPNESSWFGYYYNNGTEYSMEETECYRQDKLGLKTLRDSGKLVFLLSPRDHLEVDPWWFSNNIIPYLRET